VEPEPFPAGVTLELLLPHAAATSANAEIMTSAVSFCLRPDLFISTSPFI
jgi:hypothetical protein